MGASNGHGGDAGRGHAAATPHNIQVSGSGRLRRPPSQPAYALCGDASLPGKVYGIVKSTESEGRLGSL